jgi:hypothetical protein
MWAYIVIGVGGLLVVIGVVIGVFFVVRHMVHSSNRNAANPEYNYGLLQDTENDTVSEALYSHERTSNPVYSL